MKNLITTAALATILVGCAASVRTIPDPVQRPPFPEQEYAALPKTGTATITGQAFLKTLGGDVKVGAGEHVSLHPVTSYSTFTCEKMILQGLDLSWPDPMQATYVRTTTADASGRFAFKDVPPGDYYVVTQVTWKAPRDSALVKQGGSIGKRVTAKNGETVEAILAQ